MSFRRRGANAVEFGLTIPIFVALMIGTIEYGWLFFMNSAMSSAVANGCRQGSISDPGYAELGAANTITTARNAMIADLRSFGVGECADGCVATATLIDTPPARSLQCSMTWRVRPMMGFYTDEVTLTAQTVTRMEWQR